MLFGTRKGEGERDQKTPTRDRISIACKPDTTSTTAFTGPEDQSSKPGTNGATRSSLQEFAERRRDAASGGENQQQKTHLVPWGQNFRLDSTVLCETIRAEE